MGQYQQYKGNPENKLFYLIDNLVGGINTDFSDDASNDNEFNSIVNFTVDKKGSLYKRMGFGKLNAISEIFNKFTDLPEVKYKTETNPNPEETNDNIVYMKMLQNDNGCFRNLSAFTGDKAYREYQKLYGSQNNMFKLLIITTNLNTNLSKAWLYSCKLPSLIYDEEGNPTDEETIVISNSVTTLPVIFTWNRNLSNIDTIEYFNKIYFTGNDKGLVCFNRDDDTFEYYGSGISGYPNNCYKPSPMEIRKVGFNVLGDDPLHWVDFNGLTTDSIQGMYLTTEDDKPLTEIPSGGSFLLNILYTGSNDGFGIEFKEGETSRSATVTETPKSSNGLKVYKVTFSTQPTSSVEIKITKNSSNINPYYDYYDVGSVDKEIKPVKTLNIGDCGMTEMYSRAVYYKDDTIWFSELNNYNYVPNYNYVSLPIEPTDKITKIVFFRNVYIVFTKQRIYKIIGSFGDANFEVVPLNMGIGCHAPNTIVPIENVLYFASPRGLYELVSSVSYTSNNMSFENVKELDTKVKSLTSDVTMYLGELSDPAVRYNGISEYAYGIRYKDKYMLFFNTSYEQGDIAGLKNLDVLTYQYDIKSYSEIRFPVKPTFLFMVDNHIECFCTIPEKEIYSVEETLLEYDFENTSIINNKVRDISGNGYDADAYGSLISQPGTGVDMSDNSYIEAGYILSSDDIPKNELKLEYDIDLHGDVSNKVLFNMRQDDLVAAASTQNFTITTNWANNYCGQMLFTVYPNPSTGTARVDWTFRYYRANTDVHGDNDVGFRLVNASDGVNLISDTAVHFNFGGGTSVDLRSGSFTITYDSNRNYSKAWRLETWSSYPTYIGHTDWHNGGVIGFDETRFATNGSSGSSFNKYYGIRLYGTSEITANGQCRVRVYPRLYLKTYGTLSVVSRAMYVWIDGEKFSFSIPSVSKTNNKTTEIEPSGTKYCDKYFNYNSSSNISKTLDAQYNIKATISGTSYTNLDIDAFNISLPYTYSTSWTETKWVAFSLSSGNVTITLNKLASLSYRPIELSIVDNNTFRLYIENEYYSMERTINNPNINLNGRHLLQIKLTKANPNNLLTIYLDGNEFSSLTIEDKYLINSDKKLRLIENIDCSLYKFAAYAGSNNIMLYDLMEGTGDKLNDKSGSGRWGTIKGTYQWQVEKGLKFNGNGYLILPDLKTNVHFSNGFFIEFESRFNDIDNAYKVFDFATGYDTGKNGILKCSINGGNVKGLNTMTFNSTSISRKNYNIYYSDADLTERHKWKFNIIDNGKKYNVYLYLDGELVSQSEYAYGGITNTNRVSNFIGKSNNVNDKIFSGMLYNFKVVINKSPNPAPNYIGGMFEYDTTFDDFGEPMEVELETKGINLKYPMHQKKIKNIFVKGVGGYAYSEFFLEVYADGHLVNDPRHYYAYVNEATGEVVYDYTEEKALNFDEQQSLLGNLRLDHTQLGKTEYETKKIIIPSTKCKNVVVKIYGISDDYLSIESLGFLFKLGKVKGQ